MSPVGFAARLRGVASGLLTATLAVAAHSAGGAELPSGAAMVQLAVLATTVGALTATVRRAAQTPVLLGLLVAGQGVGHLLLGAAGHAHTAAALAAMLAAHLGAIATGATLITAGGRLCRAVSRAVRVTVRVVCPPVAKRLRHTVRRVGHPLCSALLVAASITHRGPPVGCAC
ncbi:hypothetical protein DQP55_14335 [Mycolicibacterium sp. GF69]|uniref:hypothetical protein n=1 Tax=Mycolicibacterium sp. GF69 TaxID=2267251 RepID=UPI000DCBBD1A|nr:hypothetical protein [Mycolicibacterium sp. GF69]RAV11355.1 hypothetical protein DQP55_14335 [Mycolicibacterium sp. GF69]